MKSAKEMKEIMKIRENFNKLKYEQEKFENLQIVLSYLEHRLRNYGHYLYYEEGTEEEWKILFVDKHGEEMERNYIVNMDNENQLFSIAPYDGKIFKEGLNEK